MKNWILVVDDDPPHRHLIGMLLKEAVDDGDTEVETVPSGPEALERMAQELPKAPRVLVLSDYVMPEMSGLDLLLEVKARHPDADLRFLVISSVQQVVDMDALEAAGAHEFLVKPYDLEDYVKMLRFVIKDWGQVKMAPQTSV